jgi:hypothetical protein
MNLTIGHVPRLPYLFNIMDKMTGSDTTDTGCFSGTCQRLAPDQSGATAAFALQLTDESLKDDEHLETIE